MKKNELKILKEMMKNPKWSDRAIAQIAGVSQPTVTRMRHKLENKGIIESYQIIPNLAKLGFEIIAFSVVANLPELNKDLANDERVIYAITVSKGTLVISIHETYTAYMAFESEYGALNISITVTSIDPIKPLSFANIPL